MDSQRVPGEILVTGIVGSKAYGWDTPESDTDRHGVFALPPEDFLGVDPPSADVLTVRPDADTVYHEVGHFLRLALNCNPYALDLLFLPLNLQEDISGAWQELRALRQCLLSAEPVRRTYLGFAKRQLDRIMAHRAEDLARASKNGRHLKRALDQGLALYRTGELPVQLGNREEYFEFGHAATVDPRLARDLITVTEAQFDQAVSPLPEKPRRDVFNRWLISYRMSR